MVSLPEWVLSLRRFGILVKERGLRNAIVGFVAGAIVSLFTDIATFIIGQIQAAIGAIVTAVRVPFDALVNAFEPVGDAVLDVFRTVNSILFDVVSPLGIAAPFVVIGLYALVALLVIRAVRVTVTRIPILGALADFFGVSV